MQSYICYAYIEQVTSVAKSLLYKSSGGEMVDSNHHHLSDHSFPPMQYALLHTAIIVNNVVKKL